MTVQDPKTHNEYFLSHYLRLLQQYNDTNMSQELTLFFSIMSPLGILTMKIITINIIIIINNININFII